MRCNSIGRCSFDNPVHLHCIPSRQSSDEDISVNNTLSLLIPSSDSSQSTVSLSRHQVWTALSEDGRGCFPDLLLNAGGPVWAMDWLQPPKVDSKSRPAPEVAYLALGCHPADSPLHRIGNPITGMHSIQVWEIPINPGSMQKPRLSILLQHDGGLAWHCQWCPRSAPDSDRLGLLVGALGDGSVRIWSLPVPISSTPFHSVQASEPQKSSLPILTGSPEPVASIHPHHVGGSLASRVDWLPHHPCNRLLVACWDGSIYVTQLVADQKPNAQEPHNMQVLCHFPADIVPLRTARWLPPAGNAEEHHSIDNVHQNLFLTGGQEGILKLWDAR